MDLMENIKFVKLMFDKYYGIYVGVVFFHTIWNLIHWQTSEYLFCVIGKTVGFFIHTIDQSKKAVMEKCAVRHYDSYSEP